MILYNQLLELLVSGKVGYWTKYLNPNLLALITTRTLSIDPKTNQVQSSISSIKNNPDPSINIYLIDTITGHIIDKVIHKNSQGSSTYYTK